MNHSDSFMRNKKIAQTLKEAIDSPLGSTKRKAAKSLITIMTKTVGQGGPGYYGQGGPGSPRYSPTTPGSASFATKAPRKDPDYSNMIIFPSPPAPRRGRPMTKAMAPAQTGQPGQSGQGDPLASQMGMGISNQAIQNKPAQSNFNTLAAPPDVAGAFSDVSGPTSSGLAASNAGTTTSALQQAITKALAGLKGGAGGASGQGGPGYSSLSSPQTQFKSLSGIPSYTAPDVSSLSGAMPSIAPEKPVAPIVPPAPTYPIASYADASNAPVLPGASVVKEAPALPGTTEEAPIDTTKIPEKPQEQPQEQPQPQQTPEQKSAADVAAKLAAGVKSNMGATGWAQQTMGDQGLMKEIFPDANIPAGSSLTSAVDELSKTLKQKYNIDELQSQLAQMTADGGLIGPMLTTYIQNKDSSLNEIHSQILSANDQMLHSDQGNPYESQIWSRYSDYLNNLYTAQNASYADFFNKSTKMYSDALTAQSNLYTNALNNFNSELTTKVNATEADYNNMKQALVDMYTSVQDAPMKELQLGMLKDQAALAHAQLIQSTSGSSAGQGDWVSAYKELTDMGILFDNKTNTGSQSNAGYGELLPNVTDIAGVVNTIVSNKPKIGVDGALWIVGQAFQKSLRASGGDAQKAINDSNKFQGMIIQAVSDGVIPQAMGLQMTQALIPAITDSISQFVVNTPGADATAKSAMNDALIGSGGWLGAKKVPSQADFEKKYSETLTRPLATAIYLQMQDTKNRVAEAQSATGGTGPTGTSPYAGKTIEQISQEFADDINALPTPQDVGDFLGNLVSPYITGKAIATLQPVSGQ